ncbi:TonB-dependent siderophore receptor [Pantanalinema rosaneae CENA516]|uniref:TonB-dependent siderophore receptor n=1 Tax=Pantanalinema rosaneae TaxID=1620701 RepID=UPI003D6E0138
MNSQVSRHFWISGLLVGLMVLPVQAKEHLPHPETGKPSEVPVAKGAVDQSRSVQQSAIPQIREFPRPATTLKEWQAQVEAARVQVTGVQLNSIDTGLEIVLQTAEGQLLQVDATKFRTEGNSLIAEITNAMLVLPDDSAFIAETPTPDVARVQVTQVDSSTIQVTVTGNDSPPQQEVILRTGDFAYSLNPDDEVPEEEVVVTGDLPGSSYFTPNATTGTRTNTPILDTPQSIQVIPQQVLQDQQTLRVDDALRNVSGVVGRLNPFGSSTNITIRGFTTDNFTAGAFLRDGYRLNDNFSTQETANIEQIEVIKGPASVLYGQNDPGGIINLVTKRPLSNPFYELQFQAGSYGLIRPSIDFSGPLTADRSLRYRLNVAYQHEDGFRDLEIDTNRFFIAPVLSWDIGDRTNLTIVMEYINEKSPYDLGLPAIGDRVADVPRDRVVGALDDSSESRALTLGYDLKHQFNDNWSLNHGFRYVTQDYSVLVTLPAFVDQTTGDVNLFFADREYRSDDYTIQTNVVGKFNTGSVRHTLLAGVDLNFNRLDERFTRADFSNLLVINVFNPVYGTVPRPDLSGFEPFAPYDTEYDRVGVFLQDQVNFGDQFILVGSLRYDTINFRIAPDYDPSQTNASYQSWSPRIGLIYKPVETVSLYANYSQSFKPNLSTNVSGSPLEPEKARGFEVGAKAELLNRKLFVTLAYFNITKRNVATTDPNNPFFSVLAGKQRSQGVELDIAGEILPGWNIIANYAYTDARITEDNDIPIGNRLFNAPYHSAGLWTTYEIQQGDLQGLGFGVGINYVGNRYGDLANSFKVGDYFLTNLALFYKRNNWRLGLNINNLFNVSYISSTNNSRNFGNAPGAPLTVIGTIAVEF